MTKEQLIEDTIVRLCAISVGLQSGMKLSTMCPQKPIETDIVPIKEALSMLGISEDAIRMRAKDGSDKPLDLEAIPVGIPRSKLMELLSSEV